MLNTKLNKAIFSSTIDRPKKFLDGKNNDTFEKECIKIK